MGSMNVKAFDGSQRATIREINLDLQMGPTCFDVKSQVLDISATYNLLLGRPWIHIAGAVASTLHQGSEEDEILDGMQKLFLDEEDMDNSAILEEGKEEDLTIQIVGEGAAFKNLTAALSWDRRLGDSETVRETRLSIHLSLSKKEEYISFLKEYEDIFAWSYDDMTGLSTSIVAHKLPTNPMCLPVKQKLRKFKPDMSLKIKDKVTKQRIAKLFRVVEYPTWLANIVAVLKKDEKFRVKMSNSVDTNENSGLKDHVESGVAVPSVGVPPRNPEDAPEQIPIDVCIR
ncbi:uncharacterized protein [Nicotiana sylvestris]|uniref:uncharacterized protein n=1 Tax=Nicotiana sylvestris TaxID=4096 RepID=UPI00388CDA41